jgi:plasmid stability protein
MPSITVRDVPEDTHDELAARAAAQGQSLQEYLRARLIDIARRPDARTLLEQVRARVEASGTRLSPGQILAYRDSDRK